MCTEAIGFQRLFPGVDRRMLTLVRSWCLLARPACPTLCQPAVTPPSASQTPSPYTPPPRIPCTRPQTVNFRAPLLREYLLLHGMCDVSRRTCQSLLRGGKSIVIAIGGGTEARRRGGDGDG